MIGYDRFAPFYNQLMGDPSVRTQQVLRAIRSYLPGASSLLELGCGTGEVLAGLRGISDLTGIDVSEGMLTIAREKVPAAHLVRSNVASFEFDRQFDVVIGVYDILNHLIDLEEWKSCIRSVLRALRTGGLFIFDVNTKGRLTRLAAEPAQVHEFDGNVLVMGIAQEGKEMFRWDLKVFEGVGADRYVLHRAEIQERTPTIAEILQLMSLEFGLVERSDDTGEVPDDYSDRAYFVLRKVMVDNYAAH